MHHTSRIIIHFLLAILDTKQKMLTIYKLV